MRIPLAAFLVAAVGCGSHRPDGGNGTDAPPPADACVGLECRIVDCAAQMQSPTSISGTVFAPNGTLPLYGATVYVPNSDPGPIPDGVTCGKCDPDLPGDPVARTTSDTSGHFELDDVPSGSDIPLIIQIGKWRRQVLIPAVQQCTDNPVDASLTRLPANRHEGDMPRIAIYTGACDALECLVRRLGVADTEFGTEGDQTRVHLYNGGGASTLANGMAMAPAASLTATEDTLKNYDIVMASCECDQEAANKPQASMDNMKAYADLGGRVFLSHYQNVWIQGETGNPTHAPAVWKDIATWTDNYPTASLDEIDTTSNPKGAAFAMWMTAVGGSSVSGQIVIDSGSFRQTVVTIDNAKAERWVFWDSGAGQYPQDFQFTTPNEGSTDDRCGKVVFSDMHVAGEQFSSGMFPSGCTTSPLTPQEKALAFMFFDIASCVQVIQ